MTQFLTELTASNISPQERQPLLLLGAWRPNTGPAGMHPLCPPQGSFRSKHSDPQHQAECRLGTRRLVQSWLCHLMARNTMAVVLALSFKNKKGQSWQGCETESQ